MYNKPDWLFFRERQRNIGIELNFKRRFAHEKLSDCFSDFYGAAD